MTTRRSFKLLLPLAVLLACADVQRAVAPSPDASQDVTEPDARPIDDTLPRDVDLGDDATPPSSDASDTLTTPELPGTSDAERPDTEPTDTEGFDTEPTDTEISPPPECEHPSDCGHDPDAPCAVEWECIAGECFCACRPDCAGIECGPDPLCDFSCGECDPGWECLDGACVEPRDLCFGVPPEGCCMDEKLFRCEAGELIAQACDEEAPPNNFCGWESEAYGFSCGGVDDIPTMVTLNCCEVSGSCAELERECGRHPVCTPTDCGTCAPGEACTDDGLCLPCDPVAACEGLECGLGDCQIDCGACPSETAFCDRGICVEPPLLGCNEIVHGDNSSGRSEIALYPSCVAWDQSGPEVAYLFIPEADDYLYLWLSDLEADLDLFVLEGTLSGEACIAFGDEHVLAFPVLAGMIYYIVVDGHEGATSPFTLTLACAGQCDDPQCDGRECGPSPNQFCVATSCGQCDEDSLCLDGHCVFDPAACPGVPDAGCCVGDLAVWCVEGELLTADCALLAPPADTCGYEEEAGVFDCGGNDPPPDGITSDCGFDCDSSCATLGLTCGPHPTCPVFFCGECPDDYWCNASGRCEELRKCEAEETISCGELVTGDTEAGIATVDAYPSCIHWDARGPEIVYEWTAPADDRVRVALDDSTPLELDLYVLEEMCAGSRCVAYGDRHTVFEARAGITYFIVVDSPVGVTGNFALFMECNSDCDPTAECDGADCGPSGCYEWNAESQSWVATLCGECAPEEWCDNGTCAPDNCEGVTWEGCCDGKVAKWCENGELMALDCSTMIPPGDICGWSDELNGVDCGAADDPPDGYQLECEP